MQSDNTRHDDPLLVQLDRYAAALDGPEPLQPRDLLTENRECNERLERLIATIKQLDDLTFDQLAAGPRSDCPLLELDGWKLRRVLGRGGSGIVFAAEKDGQLAAVKAILRANDDPIKARWQREADVVSQLNHRHIIPLVAAGKWGGIPYVAMRLVDGASLAEIIDWQRSGNSPELPCGMKVDQNSDGPKQNGECTPADRSATDLTLWALPAGHRQYVRAALNAVAAVADALDAAHQAGVIHRDVKPSNVLVELGGHVWLSDFGMASTPADRTLTASGMTVGTLGYMSPEQAAGMSGDPRSDIYGLGVTALELLTLTPPLASLPWRNERNRFWSGTWNRRLPGRARRVLLKMIAVDPQQRPSSASEVARQLRIAAKESGSTMSRWHRWAGTCLLLVIGLICWLAGGTLGSRFNDETADTTSDIRIDQETADAMRSERVKLLKQTATQHSWEQAVDRNHARLVIGLEARDHDNQPVDQVVVGDHFWLVVHGDARVKRDERWQRAVTFSIRGIMVAEPPQRFRVTGAPVWAKGYRPLDQEFKFLEPICLAGPISGVAVGKELYGQELGAVTPQQPVASLECIATSAGQVDVRFELPVAKAGNSNTIRHVPRELFDEEVTATPLRLEIVEKNSGHTVARRPILPTN